MPAPVVSHDQTKSYIAPHFNHLNLRNTIVPLTTPSVSCNTNTGASIEHKIMLLFNLVTTEVRTAMFLDDSIDIM